MSTTNWAFQGSADGQQWVTLRKHAGERIPPGACSTFAVAAPTGAFAHFRLWSSDRLGDREFSLTNWEIYGHYIEGGTPPKLVGRAVALATKQAGIAAVVGGGSPAHLLSGAGFTIGLGMLEHLIELEAATGAVDSAATASNPATATQRRRPPLALMALTTLVDALEQVPAGALGAGNSAIDISPEMLDSAQAFLLRAVAADGPLLPTSQRGGQSSQCFELAVTAAGLLATRRGRLRDYFAAIEASPSVAPFSRTRASTSLPAMPEGQEHSRSKVREQL